MRKKKLLLLKLYDGFKQWSPPIILMLLGLIIANQTFGQTAIDAEHNSMRTGDIIKMYKVQADDIWNLSDAARNNIPVIRNIHSHSYGNNTPSYGDVNFAKQYSQQPLNAPNTQFYIYDRVGYHSYDKNSSVMPFEFVVTGTLRKSK